MFLGQEQKVWYEYYDKLMAIDKELLLQICDLPYIQLSFSCPEQIASDPNEWRAKTDHEQIVMALLCDFDYATLNRALKEITK